MATADADKPDQVTAFQHRAVAGKPADRPELHPDPDDLIVAVGAGMKALHEAEPSSFLVDEQDNPVSAGWDAVAARCRKAVSDGLVDPALLPEPYLRYSPEQLLEMFLDGRPDGSDDPADTVVCHGRPVLGNLIVDNGTFARFENLTEVLVADRHYDLAVIHQSVTSVLGPEAVFRFYQSYGSHPNVARLEHYVLASHILGTAPRQAVG